MSWQQLIGQQPAKDYLRSALNGGRLSHAFLFKGPAGVGKRTAAYVFAQVVMCHERKTPDAACGECKSCRWFEARKGAVIGHPDVISLIKPGKGEGSAERLVGDHEPIIRLETVQKICEQLHRSPMAGARRVVIIPEAQRLCRGQAESANAFLKTLEEPPAASLIIMTSSQPEGLLETIVSRVQAVQFKRLSSENIRTGLAKLPIANEQLETIVTLADGSLGRALELLQGDLRSWRNAVLKVLGDFSAANAIQSGVSLWGVADLEGQRLFKAEKDADKVEAEEEDEPQAEGEEPSEGEVKTEAGWKRYVFRRLLELCELSFRDALVCAASGETDALLLQPDQKKLAETLAKKFGEEGCQKVLLALRESLFAVRLYVRGDVVGRALAGKMVDALAA